MAAPRLPFLYPQLFRSMRSYETGARTLRVQPSSSAAFHASRQRDQGTVSRRQAHSIESKLPPPIQQKKKTARELNGLSTKRAASSKARRDTAKRDATQINSSSTSTPFERNQNIRDQSNEAVAKNSNTSNQSGQTTPGDETQADESTEVPSPQNPMDAVLQMPPPTDMGLATLPPNGQEIPHLEPAPYIHHFDTYTLVKNLQEGGFSEDQAITVMKAIRGILQEKLDLAEDTLTSKSDSENEEYLFKAACSELQSSLQASRSLEIETQRTSRTQLQHEVDILNLRITQELAKMNDDLKGMWNEHKMTTREQQQSQDTGIQELNYKIAVSLASDGKSEAEGLRWVLTRRAAFAIVFSAAMAIAFLKGYSVRTHENERKQAVAKEAAKSEPIKDAAVQTEASLSDTLVSESLG